MVALTVFLALSLFASLGGLLYLSKVLYQEMEKAKRWESVAYDVSRLHEERAGKCKKLEKELASAKADFEKAERGIDELVAKKSRMEKELGDCQTALRGFEAANQDNHREAVEWKQEAEDLGRRLARAEEKLRVEHLRQASLHRACLGLISAQEYLNAVKGFVEEAQGKGGAA